MVREMIAAAALALLMGVTPAMANDDGTDEKPPFAREVTKQQVSAAADKASWEDNEEVEQAMKGVKYSNCTDNPFWLCSHPKPERGHPLRGCWKKLCR